MQVALCSLQSPSCTPKAPSQNLPKISPPRARRTGEPTATFGCTEASIPASQCFHVHSINASLGSSPDEATSGTWHY